MLRLVVVAAIIFFIWSLIPQAQTFHKDCRDRARGHSRFDFLFFYPLFKMVIILLSFVEYS